jgi:hypothetical protein
LRQSLRSKVVTVMNYEDVAITDDGVPLASTRIFQHPG